MIDNVMIGATIQGHATFMETLFSLPRHRVDEGRLRDAAMTALAAVGLEALADVRADRLQHSELRFVEIARALILQARLPDARRAGRRPLRRPSIERLAALIKAISRQGTGVLLVEHHADLIFDICDHVTVLNLGRVLAAGTPNEIRVAQGGRQCLSRRLNRCWTSARLSAGYGKINVLHDLTLNVTIGAGEIVALARPERGRQDHAADGSISGLLPTGYR